MMKNEWIPMKYNVELYISEDYDDEIYKQYNGSKFLGYKRLPNGQKVFKVKNKGGKVFIISENRINLQENY